MDPVTAVAIASSAFKAIKGMVDAGRDVEDTLGQLGKWYGAVSDFNEAKRLSENPPLFKKLFNSTSVEEEAITIYAQNKKIAQQERELRELLTWHYGPDGYKELVELRRKIRAQREKTVYLQSRRRKAFLWNSITVSSILLLSYSLYLMGSFFYSIWPK